MTCCEPKNKPHFRPNYREKPLTEKFYARHDALIPNPNYRQSFSSYEDAIAKRQKWNIREQRSAPLTENQVYGWLSYLADDYSTGYDPIIFKHHHHTRNEIKTQLRVITDLLRDRKRM